MRVLITGANRGIGAELASLYANAGDTVLSTSRAGQDGCTKLDVTDQASVVSAAQSMDAPIDVLICNAGVFLDRGQSLEDGFAPDLWADTFAANVTGVFTTIQAFLPKLQDGSKIAIIASQMGSSERAGGRSYIYRSSKAAAANLAANLAVDLKPRGIAVGAYHPGWVITDMGGSDAAVTVQASAAGLVTRFAQLNLDTTGCFETFDGQVMPY